MNQNLRQSPSLRKVTPAVSGISIFLPLEFVKTSGIKSKDGVEMWTDGTELIVKPVSKRKTIMERSEEYSEGYVHMEELDWGEDVGEEII